MAQAAKSRYGKGPTIGDEEKKGDENRSGSEKGASAEAKKTASAEKTPKPDTKREGSEEPGPKSGSETGTFGAKVTNEGGSMEVQHHNERMGAHASRMNDHMAMAHRHEHEHRMRESGMHGETHEAMSERHRGEMQAMHTAHEGEHRRMSARHHGGMATDAGAAEPETEK